MRWFVVRVYLYKVGYDSMVRVKGGLRGYEVDYKRYFIVKVLN